MTFQFKLPDVGEGMAEGEILRVLVRPGENVAKDQPVIEVQTDKVSAELPSPVAGRVRDIPVRPGDLVPVGGTLIVLDTNTDTNTDTDTDEETFEEDAAALSSAPSAEQTQLTLHMRRSPQNPQRPVLAAPATRRLARELAVDIEQVPGTGPAGRVTEADVRAFASRTHEQADVYQEIAPAVPVDRLVEEEERIPVRGLRRQIAEKMLRSVQVIPHVTHFDELDVTELIAVRNQMKLFADRQEIKLTYLPFIVKAVTMALKEFPRLNSVMDDQSGELVLKKYYHIGIATDTVEGLVVPVIRHADRKSLLEIAREIGELAEKARNKKLSLPEITGGTFTISNVGPIGGMFATPIINHPEVAILATHKIQIKPVVTDREKKEFDFRDFLSFSLSFDHRVIDGVEAVRFTNRMRDLLEQPVSLMLMMR